MSAPSAEREPPAITRARRIAELPPGDQRYREGADLVGELALAEAGEFVRGWVRRIFAEAGVIGKTAFDRLYRERGRLRLAGGDSAELLEGGDGDGPRWPVGCVVIDGPALIGYVLVGELAGVYKLIGRAVRRALSWCPHVRRVLEELADDGRVIMRFYEITVRGRTVVVNEDELREGAPWKVLAVTGTGSRQMREILTDVVQAQAADLVAELAITRTGWHRGPAGDWFYVYADGRTSRGDRVSVLGGVGRERLALAAAEVPPVAVDEIIAAVLAVAEHGRGPGLVGLGHMVRALAQSRHKAPGGVIAVGKKYSGKSCVGWHARVGLVARPDRLGAFPPLPTQPFTTTLTALELALDFEADMPALLDDAALHSGSTRADQAKVADILERTFRSFYNDSEIRPRSSKTMLPQPARYVRALPIATVQELPPQVQGSLLTRVLLLQLAPGGIDTAWYKRHSAELVGPLRTLAEWFVIPRLAVLGDQAPAYVAAADGAALELLAAELAEVLPGWETDADGIARVVDIAAAYLGGLLMAADALELSRDVLASIAAPYLAGVLVHQAELLGAESALGSADEALGDIVRAALLETGGGAHMRDDKGEPRPVVPGLTEQEQGLEQLGGFDGPPRYRGRGVPLYWRPDVEAVGVRSDSLHALVRRAADPRLPAGHALGLPKVLLERGLTLPAAQAGQVGTRRVRVGGELVPLVLIRAAVIFPPDVAQISDFLPGTPGTPGTGEARDVNRTAEADSLPGTPGTDEASADNPLTAPAVANVRMVPSDQADNTCSGCDSPAVAPGDVRITLADQAEAVLGGRVAEVPRPAEAEPLPEVLPEAPADLEAAPSPSAAACVVCGGALDAALARLGEVSHPCCDEAAAVAVAQADGHQAEAAAEVGLGARLMAAAAAADLARRQLAADGHQADGHQAEAAAALPWLVLGADGRAYGPGGEVLALGPGGLEAVGDAGALAALALGLGTARLWVPRPAREALGLPAEVGDLGLREGLPHRFTEVADPSAWDMRPDAPVGLAGWMTVYRVPRSGEGVALAFPEWLPASAPLADLEGAELARALDLIHDATATPGGRGGVAYDHSPGTTFKHLLAQAARWSRRGTPEAVTLPPPYDLSVKLPRGAPLRMQPPAAHVAPPAEVPAGWPLAELDVISCFASAATGTDFGLGEAEHRKAAPGGSLELPDRPRLPGAHLVMVRGASSAGVHPSLAPFIPAVGRRRDAVGWIDALAAYWLDERGVPLEVLESYVWPERARVFDSASARLGAARARLEADGTPPARAAAAIVKAMANTVLGGWLASDFGGERPADDWLARRDWWVRTRVQAEVRKQRNLLPGIEAGALVVLAEQKLDSVYVAAPSLEALLWMHGSGGKLAITEVRPELLARLPADMRARYDTEQRAKVRGKFKLEQLGEVTPALSAALADQRSDGLGRLGAIRAALGLETGK